MGDWEYNRYEEYGPRPREQAPLPPESQESGECHTAGERQTYAEHGGDTPPPSQEERKKKQPKPQPPVSRMAMQFVAISSAAVVTVTAGAVLSEGAFLPELGNWAKATVEQIAAVPPIALEQPAMDLQEIFENGTAAPEDPVPSGEASGGGEMPPDGGETPPGTDPELPPEPEKTPPTVQTAVPLPLPNPETSPGTQVTPEKPTKPPKPPKPVPPVEPIVPPKPVPPAEPIVPPKPVNPPVEPPVNPPHHPDPTPDPAPDPTPDPTPDPAPDPTPDPAPHVHSYTAAVTTPPTCGGAGVTTYTCACGGTYTEPIPATGAHSYDAGVVTPPTCTAEGYTRHTCTVCGSNVQDAPTAKSPHTVAAWSPGADGLTHTGGCSACGQAQTENHSLVDGVKTPATCLTVGIATHICGVCNFAAVETELAVLPHSFDAWTKADDTNHTHACTTPGCTISETAAHTFGGSYVNVDDTNHSHSCADCSAVVLQAHDFTGGQSCPQCGVLAGKVEAPLGFQLETDHYVAILGFSWKTSENTNLVGLTGQCLKADGTSCGTIEATVEGGATTATTTIGAVNPGDVITIEIYSGTVKAATSTLAIPTP